MKTFQTLFSKIFMLSFIALLSMGFTSCEEKADATGQVTQDDIKELKDKHIIPLKEAVKMYDKYSKDRAKILKDTLKKKYGDDFDITRSVLIDIADMKAYLKYIEDESAKIGINPEGLAFYYSVDSESKGRNKNHQGFFVAPTATDAGRQSGYTIIDGEKKYIHDAIKEYLAGTERNVEKASFLNMIRNGDGLLFNDFERCPPMDCD